MVFDRLVENVLDKTKEFVDFIVKRALGASKIEKSTRAKGGLAILTAIHFAAKAKPYADAKVWAEKDGRDKHLKAKAMEAYNKLSDLDSLSQREFQHLSGVFEAYGESYLRSVKPNSLKVVTPLKQLSAL